MNFHSSSLNPVSSHTDVFFSVLTENKVLNELLRILPYLLF